MKTLRRIIPACLALATLAAHAYEPPVAADDGWPVADARQAGWDTSMWDALPGAFADETFKRVTSVVVAHRGALLFEYYANGGGPDTLNDVRSASKTVTSMLMGAAIAGGQVPGVDAPVFGYFSDRAPHANPDPRKDKITIEDLLTMSSILECSDDNNYSSGNEERMYVTEDWVGFVLDLPVRGYPPWAVKPWESPYGRSFSYCTAGTFLLGALIESTTGMNLGDYADKVLHTPLGIEKVQWPVSPLGTYQGGGGTRYRSRDLAKLGELARKHGTWQGARVLPAEWLERSMAAQVQAREGVTYGYQWWRFEFDVGGKIETHVAMSGNGGNYVFVDRDAQTVTVITATAYGQRYMHTQAQTLYKDYVLKARPPRR